MSKKFEKKMTKIWNDCVNQQDEYNDEAWFDKASSAFNKELKKFKIKQTTPGKDSYDLVEQLMDILKRKGIHVAYDPRTIYASNLSLLVFDERDWTNGDYIFSETKMKRKDNTPKEKQHICPECGKESSCHPTKGCDMVLGRRGWRQLGVYDG